MRKLRWGVLSTAKIGLNKVLPAMQEGAYCELIALASRDLEKGKSAAASLQIPRVYGSYDALLADPDVEAVYIPLPNHLHVPYSIKALEAGKHVLCEKPIGMNAAEAQMLLDASKAHPHLKVMEAFMYRFHPQWQGVKKLLQEGKIGRLSALQSIFSYNNLDPKNVRNQADIGGGGLMDIGCYCISFSRFIFGREPVRVSALMEYDPNFETDRLTSALLDFGGPMANFTCSTQLTPYQNAVIYGNEGRIEIETPFTPQADQKCRIWRKHAVASDDLIFDAVNQYTLEVDQFALAVINDTPVPTPLEDALANMRVIDAVAQSARENRWVALP